MTRLASEPSTSIGSMEELLAVAFAMEKDSRDRYADLAERMRAAGQPQLAGVFDRLVREESGHMDMVVGWSRQVGGQMPGPLSPETLPQQVFDDEQMRLISPELLDAYRSFAIAVRNEERAFAFWSYVAAQGETWQVREAAERMAREELEHAKTLRRERRKAFFQQRQATSGDRNALDLSGLEMEVSNRLREHTDRSGGPATYRDLASEAHTLSLDLASDPLQDSGLADGPPPSHSLDALCEWLADYYIEAGETLNSQVARERAQVLATIAIRRLALVRHLEGA